MSCEFRCHFFTAHRQATCIQVFVSAGGFSGPRIFLAAGEQITSRVLRAIDDDKPGVLPNSKV